MSELSYNLSSAGLHSEHVHTTSARQNGHGICNQMITDAVRWQEPSALIPPTRVKLLIECSCAASLASFHGTSRCDDIGSRREPAVTRRTGSAFISQSWIGLQEDEQLVETKMQEMWTRRWNHWVNEYIFLDDTGKRNIYIESFQTNSCTRPLGRVHEFVWKLEM